MMCFGRDLSAAPRSWLRRRVVPARRMAAILLVVLSPVSAFGAAEGNSDPRDVDVLSNLRVGHWVEVRGELTRPDLFLADRVAIIKPKPESRLWGIAAPGELADSMMVLGRKVQIDDRTQWLDREKETRDHTAGSARDHRVRVSGHLGVRGRFLAETIEIRDPGTSRILGRVDAISTRNGATQLKILGFDVQVPSTVKQRASAALEDFDRTSPTPLRSPSSKTVDADDLLGDGYSLSRSATLRLRQDISINSQRNFEIDRRNDRDVDENDDRDDGAHNLRFQLIWAPNARTTALVDARHRWRRRELDQGVGETSSSTRLGEAWLLFRDIGFGIDLQVGRQDFDESREWLFDQNLDGIRLFRQTQNLHFELGLTTTLSDGSRRNQSAVNTTLYVSNRHGARHLASYLINRNFGGGRDTTQTHYGVRAFGPLNQRLSGWAELSGLAGTRNGTSVSAWGGDLGLRVKTLGQRRTTLSFSYALGSGDRAGGKNTEFVQTGLQDNDGRLSGLSSVRYYGELFDPELSNISIASLGIGTRIFKKTSVELQGHLYRQGVASTRLRNTNLDRNPLGESRDLGWEIDAVLALRQFARWDIEFVAAHFSPGSAFPQGDDAQLARLQVRFRY